MRLYLFPSQSARPTPNSKPQSITGRDSYIIAEALYRYIATEQAKPDCEQSWSNLLDAIAIFNATVGAMNACFFADQYSGVTVSLIDEKAPRNHSE
jgi:hypothetical protein